jgi:hypothetical protein
MHPGARAARLAFRLQVAKEAYGHAFGQQSLLQTNGHPAAEPQEDDADKDAGHSTELHFAMADEGNGPLSARWRTAIERVHH